MSPLHYKDNSLISYWWNTIDLWLLASILVLMTIGTVLIFAASPAVAGHIGTTSPYFFITRHMIFLIPAIIGILLTSLLTTVDARRLACIVFSVSVLMIIGTLLFGSSIKGATRWLYIGPLSLQPSELMKPTFCVVTAWMLSESKKVPQFPGYWISTGLFLLIISLLILQPDMGMTLIVIATWLAQLFIAGLPFVVITSLILVVMGGAFTAYMTIPHVAQRINVFLNPASGDTYQIDKSLSAFRQGGILGVGPGNGNIKLYLPDAHTDFILAVAGEEFGFIFCIMIIGLFGFIVLRCLFHLLAQRDIFIILAVGGLICQFGLQTIVNIGVNLHLLPTKGMTLPFISYGGSSLWGWSFGMGLVLTFLCNRKTYITDKNAVMFNSFEASTR